MLAESFNATAARLEQLVGAQRGVRRRRVAPAAHAARRAAAAAREPRGRGATAPRAEDLDGALAEVARLSRLVDGLLVLARAEQAPSAPAPVASRRSSTAACDAWDAFAAERTCTSTPSVAGLAVARATPGRLEQVVDNLLNNALEVAPAGSAVRVAAARAGRLGRAARAATRARA